MSLSFLFVFALALVGAAGSPGPSIAALVTRTLSNGFRDVLPFLLAMWFGEALWLTFAVTGLSVVAQTFGMVFTALKFLGAAYLLFLAWNMWTAPADVSRDTLPAQRAWWRMAMAGLMVRSEEHTSELQSLMRISYAVFCLKNTKTHTMY